MPWTAPATWTTNQLVTASDLNTYVRDNQLALEHPYYSETADKDVNTTNAQTSCFTGSPVLTGGDMGTEGRLRIILQGDLLFNNSGSDTLTFRVKLGGTTLIDSNATALEIGTSATRAAWWWETEILNRGANGAQLVTSILTVSDIGGPAPTTGTGSFNRGNNPWPQGVIQNTTAIDTTVNKAIDCTVQWSASSANNSWRVRSARITLAKVV